MPAARDLQHMTLRRRSAIGVWTQLTIRIAILLGLLAFIILVHWLERDSFKDTHDGAMSFTDVLYFTMISVTTTGYGDIVPVSDNARMFDAFFVTPIRIIFLLLLAGTAYTFAIKRTWNRLLMRTIQKNLRDHIVMAGHGASNAKALQELLAAGVDPRRIVVIDKSEEAVDRADACGVNVLLGDASRDETLEAAHVERAAALLVSAGRDDSAILIVLTARKLAPDLKISATIRETDNEDIAKRAGADTVVNPISFAGLLLASSLHGPHRAEYLSDLASTAGGVLLRERRVGPGEAGVPASTICTGQVVRLVRDGKPYPATDPAVGAVREGDLLLEIIDCA